MLLNVSSQPSQKVRGVKATSYFLLVGKTTTKTLSLPSNDPEGSVPHVNTHTIPFSNILLTLNLSVCSFYQPSSYVKSVLNYSENCMEQFFSFFFSPEACLLLLTH